MTFTGWQEKKACKLRKKVRGLGTESDATYALSQVGKRRQMGVRRGRGTKDK